MRDNFPKTTTDRLGRRVGFHCSNPDCQKLTIGPHSDPNKSVNIGVAAHITAASPGGPRFDASMTAEDRTSIHNGIWLCQFHAKLIDDDEDRYPVSLLHEWKNTAENYVRRQLEGGHARHTASHDLLDRIDSLVIAAQQNAENIDALKDVLREYAHQLIDNITPDSVAGVASGIVEMIPLDNGYWLHPDDVAAEGQCSCDRKTCVDSEDKVYCFWADALSDWVIEKRLYWKCYDEVISCPRCGNRHKRGHVGKQGECGHPYKDQLAQTD